MNLYELLTYGMVGLGLAASCGFRVFVPMLFMSCAVHAGSLELSEGWKWIGSWPAIASFGLATLVEVGGCRAKRNGAGAGRVIGQHWRLGEFRCRRS